MSYAKHLVLRHERPQWRPHRMYSAQELLDLRQAMWKLRSAGLLCMSSLLEALEALDDLEQGRNALRPNTTLRAVMAEATAKTEGDG